MVSTNCHTRATSRLGRLLGFLSANEIAQQRDGKGVASMAVLVDEPSIAQFGQDLVDMACAVYLVCQLNLSILIMTTHFVNTGQCAVFSETRNPESGSHSGPACIHWPRFARMGIPRSLGRSLGINFT